MTTRLYIDQPLAKGETVRLPAEELRYLKSVKRGQGSIEIFNRQSQVARGTLKGAEFYVLEVSEVVAPVYPITIAVGLPENSIMPQIIRSLSELGVSNLIFFNAGRSQKARDRMKASDSRWKRLAIESARQCGRGRPLEITSGDWRSVQGYAHRWFCDEAAGSDLSHVRIASSESILIVVGCEGGWTEEERQDARDLNFRFAHFATPVLRVETAVVCAGFMGIQACADAVP